MNKTYTCAGFFAGVGGIETAFENQGFKTIYVNEIDKYAVTTYEANHSLKVDCKDIRDIRCKDLPPFDIMLAGWPCQPFSLAGYRQGFDDEQGRGTLFFELERIFKNKKPKIIFLENVKNLVGHDHGNTFRIILNKLMLAGYHVKFKVLNAMDFGNIPQNRERIYIVAFRNKRLYQKFDFPKPVKLTTKLSDVIDFETKVDDKYYYTENSCGFYNTLKEQMNNPNAIYQWRRVYVRENKSGVVPTLTANMGTGGHNVPLILARHGIRKLTPLECFKVQGFPENFTIPEGLSNTRAYKQAGNSVVVPVIDRIAEEIKKIL